MTDPENKSDNVPTGSETFEIAGISQQPLNTLHLTERVLKLESGSEGDRFNELLGLLRKSGKVVEIQNRIKECKGNCCKEFKKRLDTSITRIIRKFDDKTSSNPYFLLLFELPYIFLDGKIVAGFESIISDNTTGGISPNQEEDGRFKVGGDIAVREKLWSYVEFVKGDDRNYGQKSSRDKAGVYYYRVIINPAYRLHLLWITEKTDSINCARVRFGYLNSQLNYRYRHSQLSPLFSNNYSAEDLHTPKCLKIRNTQRDGNNLQKTTSHESIEQYLFDRKYLDKSLEVFSVAVRAKLKQLMREFFGEITYQDNPFRGIFLRTKRPDVNYLAIPVTPEMAAAIYEKVSALQESDIASSITELREGFKKYFHENKGVLDKKSVDASGQQYKDTDWSNFILNWDRIEKMIKNLQERNIDLENISYEAIYIYEKELDPNTGSAAPPPQSVAGQTLGQEDLAIVRRFYLTYLYRLALENTPLAAGVAYNVGKRGIVDYSFCWHEDHPYIRLHKDSQNRYPEYFKKVDRDILASDKYSFRVDIPLVYNEKLFGILNVYPPAEFGTRFDSFQSLVSNLIEIVNEHTDDILRAYFLDVCANVIDILSVVRRNKGENKKNTNAPTSKAIESIVKEIEGLLRCTHGIPRTYVITEEEGKFIKEKLSGICGCEYSTVEKMSCETHKYKVCTVCMELAKNIKQAFKGASDAGQLGTMDIATLQADLPRNLKQRILNGQENFFTGTWYFEFIRIRLQVQSQTEKTVLVVFAHTKSPKQRSLMENISANYLSEAIETGFRAYIKNEEILRHGTRAAVAAIMGRNMSHNIGSHVLSHWTSYLKNKLKSSTFTEDDYDEDTASDYIEILQRNDSGKSEARKLREQAVHYLKRLMGQIGPLRKIACNSCENDRDNSSLFVYLKQRMDFIAEISTATPAWMSNMMFCRDLLIPFLQQKILLNNIVLTEGIHRDGECQSLQCKKNNHVHVKFIVRLDNNEIFRAGNVRDEGKNMYFYKTLDRSTPEIVDDIMVAIPHGMVGRHAFYSILENFIRNSAKHGGKGLLKGDKKKDLEITIMLKTARNESEQREFNDFVRVSIKDNAGNCNNDILSELSGALENQIVNDDGSINKGSWGIKEKRISANFLRMGSPTDLGSKENAAPKWSQYSKDLNLLAIACGMSCSKKGSCDKPDLAYCFYLLKPKEAVIVHDDAFSAEGTVKEALEQKGIYTIQAEKFTEEYLKKGIPHRFLVVLTEDSRISDLIEQYREKLPYRILTSDKNAKVDSIAFYSSWLEKQFSTGRENIKIFCRDIDVTSEDDTIFVRAKVFRANLFEERKKIIFFEHHMLNIETALEKGAVYYQAYKGDSCAHRLLSNMPATHAEKDLRCLEIAEAGLTKIFIADERVLSKAEKETDEIPTVSVIGKDKKDQGKFSRIALLKHMGIHLLPLENDRLKISNLQEDLDKELPHFFIVHQGIIDKMDTREKEEFDKIIKDRIAQSRESGFYFVITSGRGLPRGLPENARFIELSALEQLIEESDKYGLVQLLYSLRRPGDE